MKEIHTDRSWCLRYKHFMHPFPCAELADKCTDSCYIYKNSRGSYTQCGCVWKWENSIVWNNANSQPYKTVLSETTCKKTLCSKCASELCSTSGPSQECIAAITDWAKQGTTPPVEGQKHALPFGNGLLKQCQKAVDHVDKCDCGYYYTE